MTELKLSSIYVSCLDQHVHPVWGRGWGIASYKFWFIRVHDNLMQDPSYNKSIT